MASLFERFPIYKYSRKKVRLGGVQYEAWIVKGHSTLEGIIRHSKNIYAHDPWANASHYVYTNYIKRKGGDWEKISNQELGKMVGKINPQNCGLFEILFAFEDEISKEEFKLEKQLKELEELKENVKSRKKLLQILKANK